MEKLCASGSIEISTCGKVIPHKKGVSSNQRKKMKICHSDFDILLYIRNWGFEIYG